jgi:hypothetical protein
MAQRLCEGQIGLEDGRVAISIRDAPEWQKDFRKPLPLASIQRRFGKPASCGRENPRLVLLAAFAGIVLSLASVGLYGVLSRMVAECRQEIGVRMARGVRPKDVLTMLTMGIARRWRWYPPGY